MRSRNSSASFKSRAGLGFCLFLAAVFVLCGCAASSDVVPGAGLPERDEYALGKALLNGVFSSYRIYTRDSFDRKVSRDFNPVRGEFVNSVERGFYGAQQLEILPIVNSVARNRDLVSVSFRWQKKVVPYTGGGYRNLSGNAEYVFREENGKWQLYRVSGDDPMAMN